jgi:hypothetical protein
MNLVSRRQIMNTSFDPLHLVNTYGAFGTVTRQRFEVILKATDEAVITPATKWREYHFKGKPGALRRAPCLVSPYHYKIDWQMWFAAMSGYYNHPWILALAEKILEGDKKTIKLLAQNPFPEKPPRYIKADLYLYRFTTREERRITGAWWHRIYVEEYFPVFNLPLT